MNPDNSYGYSGEVYAVNTAYTRTDAIFENISLRYVIVGSIVLIFGRFRLSDQGTQSGYILVTLPNFNNRNYIATGSGFCGSISRPNLVVRKSDTGQYIEIYSNGGNYCVPSAPVGYYEISAITFLK